MLIFQLEKVAVYWQLYHKMRADLANIWDRPYEVSVVGDLTYWTVGYFYSLILEH